MWICRRSCHPCGTGEGWEGAGRASATLRRLQGCAALLHALPGLGLVRWRYGQPRGSPGLPTLTCNPPGPSSLCKGGTSLAALEDCWAPTPHQGPPGATARGWETLGPGPAASSGARLLPCASPMVDGRSLGREGGTQPGQLGCRTKAAPGASCPHPLAWQPDWEVGRMLWGWQSPHHTHPVSGRRSSRKSPRPGPPGTSA